MKPLRVGVIGCGLIAQVMHLPHLAELSERFELIAVCDTSKKVVEACAEKYAVPGRHTNWRDLLDEPLQAVLILASGDHAPMALAAIERGFHVFVEKPMAYSVESAFEIVEQAEQHQVRVMVGMMKRYDPAYERACVLVSELADLRMVRVTTLESPFEPYVAHYQLVKGDDLNVARRQELAADEQASLDRATGPVSANDRWAYRYALLENLVHEFDALRGVLGEPSAVRFADLTQRHAFVSLDFDGIPCQLAWIDLPGMAAYRGEFAFYSPDRRIHLTFPSPFLRNMPTMLTTETDVRGSVESSRVKTIVSYDEAFKRELLEFGESICAARAPRTSAIDGMRDLILCAATLRSHRTAIPVELDMRARGSAVIG